MSTKLSPIVDLLFSEENEIFEPGHKEKCWKTYKGCDKLAIFEKL